MRCSALSVGLRVSGFGLFGLGNRVKGLGFMIKGLGFGI